MKNCASVRNSSPCAYSNYFEHCRILRKRRFWASSCFGLQPPWPRTTEPWDAHRSRADFVSKLGIVLEEADESVFWIELLTEGEIVAEARLEALHKEAQEIMTIFAASFHTARAKAK